MKVETVTHKDVRGNVKLYIKFTNDQGEDYLINVGEKTYTEIGRLLNVEMVKAVEKLEKLNKPK